MWLLVHRDDPGEGVQPGRGEDYSITMWRVNYAVRVGKKRECSFRCLCVDGSGKYFITGPRRTRNFIFIFMLSTRSLFLFLFPNWRRRLF